MIIIYKEWLDFLLLLVECYCQACCSPISLFISQYIRPPPPSLTKETSDIDNMMASLLSLKIASNKCSGIAL